MLNAIHQWPVQLAVLYLVVAVLMLPRYRWRWPDAEEWAALLWPVIFAALLVLILICLPFFAADQARKLWRKVRHG